MLLGMVGDYGPCFVPDMRIFDRIHTALMHKLILVYVIVRPKLWRHISASRYEIAIVIILENFLRDILSR